MHIVSKTRGFVSLLICLILGVPIIIVACGNDTSSLPFFPVLKEPESIYPAALARGRLVLDDNCLRLKPSFFFSKGDLLIWPYGYSIVIEGNEIRVIDNEGLVVARVGDRIKVGGGEIPLEIVEKYIGESLSDKYTGPYWLVSRVVED